MIKSTGALFPENLRSDVFKRQTGVDKVSPASQVPEIIVIGASTGGPQALDILLQGMARYINDVHVFVVLHTLAEVIGTVTHHVANLTSLPVEIATHHGSFRKGVIYFAPGGHHLGFSSRDFQTQTILSEAPPENFCRPSVDFLFRSAAKVFGAHVLGIVLSGMGCDGLIGSRAIVEAGGNVIAQSRASSVVWGMPGSIVDEHLASAVLPVELIAPTVGELLRSKTNGGFAHDF